MSIDKARIARYINNLPPSAKQALLDLNLREGDILPEEFVPGLEAHGVHPVKWSGGLGYVVPGELVEFLDEQQGENA